MDILRHTIGGEEAMEQSERMVNVGVVLVLVESISADNAVFTARFEDRTPAAKNGYLVITKQGQGGFFSGYKPTFASVEVPIVENQVRVRAVALALTKLGVRESSFPF
jgi:hypothetical protein